MKSLIFGVSLALMSALSVQGVTLNVEVPDGTKKCYVCGSFNGWDASGALQMDAVGQNLFRLDIPDADAAKMAEGYKYLCGQDWLYVEKDASGGEIDNRTAPGNPDIVLSWRTVPEWSVESVELTVNGIPRLIKIYLPDGYGDDPTATYPVIYYNCVQQRYNNAGDDSETGDYFFGPASWNAHDTMESLRTEGSPAYIMVHVPSFLAENTIAAHPDFMGSGKMEAYYNAFATEVMNYVENNLRVKKGGTDTVIVGADYGANFAIYAAAAHPEKFSRCVAMSPMVWVNRDEFMQIASEASQSRFYISAGALEPEWMRKDASDLANVLSNADGVTSYFTLYPGESHNDDAWGRCFPAVLKAMAADGEPLAINRKANNLRSIPVEPQNLENEVYTLYAGPDANNMERIGILTFTDEYYKKGSDLPSKALTITYDISTDYKSKYYWNIACGPDNTSPWLFSSTQNIGFSSKKDATSWHNVAIFVDGSTQNNAAHSKGFRVVTSKESVIMSPAGGHTSTATVKFPGEDKSFKVHFGSVNSASDMGALTSSISVSYDCIEAEILYDFELNKVIVNETKYGVNLDKVKVTSFTAVPAVAVAGSNIEVALGLSGDCDVELHATHNFNENVGIAFTKVNTGQYHLTLDGAKEGMYTFAVDLVADNNRLEGAAEINVRVLPAAEISQKGISVNPYKDIDWNSIKRYKANFHTHTSQSFDTQYTTTQVVDKYHAANYSILALTDHDANPYPWTMFDLWHASAESRDPAAMDMLAIPGCELSKDRRNNWSESTGGEFNHHTDLFTGRQGQEFMSLRESYAYTEALGGLQIINHPGQYWNLSTNYKNGEKNSPEWHAENFMLYKSLLGMEAYNQGNRRANDRILWDQILTITMPERPVWGFSCDDTHTEEQYFRNYQFMLMPELSVDALKDALKQGNTVFSYEYTGSGKDLCPHISSIEVDDENHTITINSEDADNIQWISSVHTPASFAAAKSPTLRASVSSTPASTVVAHGTKFDFTKFSGTYVRALLKNKYGETATQPFGFSDDTNIIVKVDEAKSDNFLSVSPRGEYLLVKCTDQLERISVVNTDGMVVRLIQCGGANEISIPTSGLDKGVYILVAAGARAAYTNKFILE